MDFFAIGDIVVDDFLRLKDAHVTCKINREECEICMRWGDKIPIESHTTVTAVGNAANAAVAAARLGASAALRGYVGGDSRGKDCLELLRSEHVDTSYMVTQADRATNFHYVLWFEDQRTILVKHEEFSYGVPELKEEPAWVYLSSLAANSLEYHHHIAEWLKKYPNARLAFQPGTFQMKLGVESIKDIYTRTDIFFCNKEEAELILNKPAGSDIRELLQGIQALGPMIVVITDDKRGAYSRDKAGVMLHCPRYPDPRPPYEITGAGDAFASTTTVAVALGKTLKEALAWGATNASAVLQEIGAQKGLLSRAELEKRVANPPAPFAVEPFV